MSEVPTKVIVDCSNGTSQIVTLTAEELAQREADAAEFAAQQAAREAAAAAEAEAKASGIAKLMALGLTEEEAQALTK